MIAYFFLLLATISDRESRVMPHVQAIAREPGAGLPIRIYADGDRIERILTPGEMKKVIESFPEVGRWSAPCVADPTRETEDFVEEWFDEMDNDILVYRGREKDGRHEPLAVLFFEEPEIVLFVKKNEEDWQVELSDATREKILRRIIALFDDAGQEFWYRSREDDGLKESLYRLVNKPIIDKGAKQILEMLVGLVGKPKAPGASWEGLWTALDDISAKGDPNQLRKTIERCIEISGKVEDLKTKENWVNTLYRASFTDPVWGEFLESEGVESSDLDIDEEVDTPVSIAQAHFEQAAELEGGELWELIEHDIDAFDRQLPEWTESHDSNREGLRTIRLRNQVAEEGETPEIVIKVGPNNSGWNSEAHYDLPSHQHRTITAGILPLLAAAGLLVTLEEIRATGPSDVPVFVCPISPPTALDFLRGTQRSHLTESRHRLVAFLLEAQPWMLTKEEADLVKGKDLPPSLLL